MDNECQEVGFASAAGRRFAAEGREACHDDRRTVEDCERTDRQASRAKAASSQPTKPWKPKARGGKQASRAANGFKDGDGQVRPDVYAESTTPARALAVIGLRAPEPPGPERTSGVAGLTQGLRKAWASVSRPPSGIDGKNSKWCTAITLRLGVAMKEVVDHILEAYQLVRPLDAEGAAESTRRTFQYLQSLQSAGQRDAIHLTKCGLAYLREMHEGRDPRYTGC